MSNLSLLAAEASGRGEGFTSSDAVDLPASHLLSCGYVCLAQEGGFCLTVEPPEGELQLKRCQKEVAHCF